MTSQHTCQSCGTVFQSNWPLQILCNVCQQTREMKKFSFQQEANARKERERISNEQLMAQFWADYERGRARNAQIRAEQEKAAAIRQQNRILQESRITSKEAYDEGYDHLGQYLKHYDDTDIDDEAVYVYYNKGKICTILPSITPYESNHLRRAFLRGIQTKINELLNHPKFQKLSIKQSAYDQAVDVTKKVCNIDFDIKEENIRKRIYCSTRVKLIGDFEIWSIPYVVDYHLSLDVDTGEINILYTLDDAHEDDTEFVEYFNDGIYDAAQAINSEENKKQRLLDDVPKVNKQLRKKKVINFTINTLITSMFTVASLIFYMLYQIYFDDYPLITGMYYVWPMVALLWIIRMTINKMRTKYEYYID